MSPRVDPERSMLAMAGLAAPSATGRHPIEMLTTPAALPILRDRVLDAIAVLQSTRSDAEARAEAFKALTGVELLLLVDEVPR